LSSTKRTNSFTWIFQVCFDWMLAAATIQPWPTNSNLITHCQPAIQEASEISIPYLCLIRMITHKR
jgi:hypothetical protein